MNKTDNSDTFIEDSKKYVLKKFKNEGNDLFMELLTHTRVLLFSFHSYKKNHLSDEDKETFGLHDEVQEIFESIDRSEFILAYTYLIVNHLPTFKTNVMKEAYELALKAYAKNAKTLGEIDNAKFFEHSKKRILKQYFEEQDKSSVKFFDLYTDLAKKYMLTTEEHDLIKKDLKKHFDELLVLDLAFTQNGYEGDTNDI